jgi:hypothetical protein
VFCFVCSLTVLVLQFEDNQGSCYCVLLCFGCLLLSQCFVLFSGVGRGCGSG